MKSNTQSKSASRAKMMREIKKAFPELFVKKSEEFYCQDKGTGIWTSGEDGVFDYYGPWSYGLPYYIDAKMHELLERNGWYVEWNDPGTVMLYPSE